MNNLSGISEWATDCNIYLLPKTKTVETDDPNNYRPIRLIYIDHWQVVLIIFSMKTPLRLWKRKGGEEFYIVAKSNIDK